MTTVNDFLYLASSDNFRPFESGLSELSSKFSRKERLAQ